MAKETPKTKELVEDYKIYDNKTLTHFTIKQINNIKMPLNDETISVDGKECRQVILVGQVEELHMTQQNNILFLVNDLTGIIQVKLWIDDLDQDEFLDDSFNLKLKYVFNFFFIYYF